MLLRRRDILNNDRTLFLYNGKYGDARGKNLCGINWTHEGWISNPSFGNAKAAEYRGTYVYLQCDTYSSYSPTTTGEDIMGTPIKINFATRKRIIFIGQFKGSLTNSMNFCVGFNGNEKSRDGSSSNMYKTNFDSYEDNDIHSIAIDLTNYQSSYYVFVAEGNNYASFRNARIYAILLDDGNSDLTELVNFYKQFDT